MRDASGHAEIRQFLRGLLLEVAKLPEADIREEATLDCELRMESVTLVEIQTAIEDEFDIELDVLRVVELNRFGLIVDYICECVRARVGAGTTDLPSGSAPH